MKYGVVIRNVTDLRAKASFRSERKSQLLFNDPVTIEKKKGGYCFIHRKDGYNGWVDENGLYILGKREFLKYTEKYNYQVRSLTARAVAVDDDNGKAPPYLFYGTRLRIIKRKGHLSFVETPFGRPLRVSLSNTVPIIIDTERIRPLIINDAKRFLGTPYLWGGITPFGIDCSGMVHILYRRFGIELPRDSKDQIKQGEKIAEEEIKPADLFFFKGHVAIALDKKRFIHASLGEGGVAINSLDKRAPDFRKDLLVSFLEVRRVLP